MLVRNHINVLHAVRDSIYHLRTHIRIHTGSSICLLKCHQHLTRIIITKTYKMNVTQNMLPAIIWLIGHYSFGQWKYIKTKRGEKTVQWHNNETTKVTHWSVLVILKRCFSLSIQYQWKEIIETAKQLLYIHISWNRYEIADIYMHNIKEIIYIIVMN